MSYNYSIQGKPLRPLGSVRPALTLDSPPMFPPLKSPPNDPSEMGIQGSAMTMPPQRMPSPERIVQQRERPSPKALRRPVAVQRADSHTSSRTSATGAGGSSAKDSKELKDARVREKQQAQELQSLHTLIEELKSQLKQKDKSISELQLRLSRQEEQHKESMEKESLHHEETKRELITAQSQIHNANNKLQEAVAQHEIKVTQLNNLMETRLAKLSQERDAEIAVRDEKLNRLKIQMADALKGNSWERQQQLDELTRELGKVQEEADMLRLRLKSLQKTGNSQGRCSGCDSLGSHLSRIQLSSKDKDARIKELQVLCTKLKKQLEEQDALLRQHAESRGLSESVFHK